MDKKELIELFVKNYYAQVEIVKHTEVSLETYLRGIMTPDKGYTEEDVQYGLSLSK